MVDDLLNQLNSKFNNLSGELLGKSTSLHANLFQDPPGQYCYQQVVDQCAVDEMSRRLDHLEANIAATNTQNEAESEG